MSQQDFLATHVDEKGFAEHIVRVQDVMKPRDNVFACSPRCSMKDVLKILLMTQQNCALIVDDDGVYGIVTPRDGVKAFADGEANSVCVADWLRSRQTGGITNRLISTDASLKEAAALMTARKLQHLVVVPSGGREAVGVLSSLDLVLSTKACRRLFPPMNTLSPGPRLEDLLTQHPHLTALCSRHASLGEVASSLLDTARTSAALELSPYRLLTEHDLMRAYVEGWPSNASAERWLTSQQAATSPQHLMVPPSMSLVEAAELILRAGGSGYEPCHHLVVKGIQNVGGGWAAVFSALDVARGLCNMDSKLEVAKTGADEVTVNAVMKPIQAVPKCGPGDTLHYALGLLVTTRQGAALVIGEDGSYRGVLTPRCALEAMAKGISFNRKVAEWLKTRTSKVGPRLIRSDARLLDAAAVMTAASLHHLIVMDPQHPDYMQPVGVLSSLDLTRGVASMRCCCPFISLAWLRFCRGPSTCAVWAA
eukprot:TRINITY_DN17106_c0_g1_i1.p1 TRINITY_DN17106_c0_g1~~TRINITY_DN17106_c0_g1_i1.p1  ORF type:complete len:506 (+),score=85.90 TRINITY_DN17106_c0_g1_i1:79-1518(+)